MTCHTAAFRCYGGVDVDKAAVAFLRATLATAPPSVDTVWLRLAACDVKIHLERLWSLERLDGVLAGLPRITAVHVVVRDEWRVDEDMIRGSLPLLCAADRLCIEYAAVRCPWFWGES